MNHKLKKGETIRGYKVVLPTGKSKYGDVLYEVGKEYIHKGDIKICNSGYHFCLKSAHCFSYYSFDNTNKVFEVEAFGDYQTHEEDSKICTGHLRVLRELSWEEVLKISNDGKNNTGLLNSGNMNSGNSNSGYRNSGNTNSGDRNSGDWNSGNSNSGNRNGGNSNSGYSNSGDWNNGSLNSGYWNSGSSNSGNRNGGNSNSGNWNSGNRNSGNSNSGDRNSGYSNSGNSNSGYSNSGNSNSGDRNSGNMNTGDRNSGDWNSGNRNSGYMNSGDSNSGAFCTIKQSFTLFNKTSEWTENKFINSKVYNLMNSVNVTLWIQESIMTDKEKEENPKYKTTEGYLKTISYKEAFINAWRNWNTENKKEFIKLPNFDIEIFKSITGLKDSDFSSIFV